MLVRHVHARYVILVAENRWTQTVRPIVPEKSIVPATRVRVLGERSIEVLSHDPVSHLQRFFRRESGRPPRIRIQRRWVCQNLLSRAPITPERQKGPSRRSS